MPGSIGGTPAGGGVVGNGRSDGGGGGGMSSRVTRNSCQRLHIVGRINAIAIVKL